MARLVTTLRSVTGRATQSDGQLGRRLGRDAGVAGSGGGKGAGRDKEDSPKTIKVWPRIADSNSRNAVSISSACTTKRFPSSRCASAIQIVRPLESIAERQPQLQPASGIVDHLRRRFARFKLCAHLL